MRRRTKLFPGASSAHEDQPVRRFGELLLREKVRSAHLLHGVFPQSEQDPRILIAHPVEMASNVPFSPEELLLACRVPGERPGHLFEK
jgi:hypothetical protein